MLCVTSDSIAIALLLRRALQRSEILSGGKDLLQFSIQ